VGLGVGGAILAGGIAEAIISARKKQKKDRHPG